jgi:Icc protein
VVSGHKSDRFRIWQFSDIHLYADAAQKLYGVNCDASLQAVLSLAQSTATTAEFCLLTGDLVQDGSAAAYRRLLGYFENLSVPAYCLPGNHDTLDLMRRILSSTRVGCQDHILYRRWLVVLLDTTINGSNAGYLSVMESQRLEALIQQYPDRHVLLAMHHPPLPTTMQWLERGVTLENPEQVHQLVANHSCIRGVVWGHAHQAFQEMRADVLWAGCPSTMAQFKPGVDEFELDSVLAGFRYIDLLDDGSIESGVMRVVQSEP